MTDDETLDPKQARRTAAAAAEQRSASVEILFHPDLRRVGDRHELGSADDTALMSAQEIGRETLFKGEEGSERALGDPCISRRQVSLRWTPSVSRFAVEPIAGARREVRVLDERGRSFGEPPVDAPPGSVLALGDRVLLRLGIDARDVEPRGLGLLGSSLALHQLRARIAAVAALEHTVLVRGPVGAGKECVARAIHAAGPRARGPLLAVNCAALPEALIEAELFGHVRGAFSGATSSGDGVVAAASGGTLLLDEIGELPLPVQAKLLRVLELNAVRPIGATTERQVDVRVVAATNRDLHDEVASGRFRTDLLSRLESLILDVPPLVEHRGDIPLLFVTFLSRLAEKDAHAAVASLFREADDGPPALPLELFVQLLGRDYRHNVRELDGLAARVAAQVIAGEAPRIDKPPTAGHTHASLAGERPDRDTLRSVLERNDYAQGRAARELGVSHTTIDRWMRELGFRRAKDLTQEEVSTALEHAGGDIEAAARELGVSERGLVLRVGTR